MKKLILLCILTFSISYSLFATHNVAGEIVYRQLSNTEVEATVFTYTAPSSIAADRDSLHICWGDGNCDRISRTNGVGNQGEPISDNIKMNKYVALHTYQSMGTYTISMTDPNRNGGILNVNFPNSENVPFKIIAEIRLADIAEEPYVRSPILLNPPIDIAMAGSPFMHTPNAFSLQGDSLAYELTDPIDVPNYVSIEDGGNGIVTINEETGLLIWDAPETEGTFVLAYWIKFYRDGEEVGRMVRDMMIEVVPGFGAPPEITMANISGNAEIIEVELGDTILLEVTVQDADANQQLEITANCGLFMLDNPPMFIASASGNAGTATFEWIVQESHLRAQNYQLTIRAMDDYPDHPGSSLAVVRFKTLGFTTGLFDLPTFYDVEVYPNPVQQGVLNLSLDQENLPDAYRIFNAVGQELSSGIISSANPVLDVKDLAQGLYYISLERAGARWTSSFFVQ